MTQTLLHTDAFTQKNFYTQTCAHSTLLRTASFLHGKTLLPLPDHLPFRVPPSSLDSLFIQNIQKHRSNTCGQHPRQRINSQIFKIWQKPSWSGVFNGIEHFTKILSWGALPSALENTILPRHQENKFICMIFLKSKHPNTNNTTKIKKHTETKFFGPE